MFTGIVETMAKVEQVSPQGSSLKASLSSSFTSELKIDQSISHDGVCLTVVEIRDEIYTVDIVKETLQKSNLKSWKPGRKINIERSVTMQQRLDGHIVQGHVDAIGKCIEIINQNGSWLFTFSYAKEWCSYLIPQGSICVNGTSLTVAKLSDQHFSVAIIPYTFLHTNFQELKIGDEVNLEFDMIGKYVNQIMKHK